MPVSFDNTEIAFASKDEQSLRKAIWLFGMMNKPWLVKVGSFLAIVATKLNLPIDFIVKPTIYNQFCGDTTLEGSESTFQELDRHGIHSMTDYALEGKQNEGDFERTTAEIKRELEYGRHHHNVNVVTMKLTGIARFGLLRKLNKQIALSEADLAEWERVRKRLDSICAAAASTGTLIYVDAEETWIQIPMDDLVHEMMAKYNKETAVVFNTVQLYRHDRLDFLKQSHEAALAKGYVYGIKLVRGAYMEKERARAARKGYPSPIQATKEATDRDYDLAIEYCVDNLDTISFIAATHNEHSCHRLVNLIETRGIDKDHPHISFGQLYGMSDNISFNLAQAGFNVGKHVPYGPVSELIPYLIRRAQENTSISGQMSRELGLLKKELARRKG
jgi:proline dehydrogenase